MNDIFLVTVDSLRADHCGWFDDADLTPTLDGIARESLTFTSAISPGPRTLSSVPVSHTGVHFPETDHDLGDYEERIARIRNHVTRFETISERLQERGYTTMAFTSNPWTSVYNDFDIGFDTFREVANDGGAIEEVFSNTPLRWPARFFDQWIHKDKWFSQWRTFYPEIVEAVDSTEGPVFAWIFLLDTHNPYIVPRTDLHESSLLGMYSAVFGANSMLTQSDTRTSIHSSLTTKTLSNLKAAYRDSVRSVDKFVRRLKDDVLTDETTFLFHSDHGEAFGEHGSFGHTQELHKENVHVPLLLYDGEHSGSVSAPIGTDQIPAMLLRCAEREDLDPDTWTSEYAFSRTEDSTGVAIRGRRWKYIQNEGEVLYDIQNDPDERNDVSDANPELVDKFRSLKDDYLSSLPQPQSEFDSVEGDEMRDHLESLGYLQ